MTRSLPISSFVPLSLVTVLFLAASCSSDEGSGSPSGDDVAADSTGDAAILDDTAAPDDVPDTADEDTGPTQPLAWTTDPNVPQAGLGGLKTTHFSGYQEGGDAHLYFCGEGGVVRVREPDGEWRNEDLTVSERINHCHVVSDDLMAAVGDTGRVWKNVGSGWSSNDIIQTSPNLRGVWVTDVGTLRVVGVGGTLMRLDNATWTSEAPAGVTGTLEALWGADANTLYATGDDGVLRYDGSTWTVETLPADPPGTPVANQGFKGRAIWGADADNVWAVGEQGKVMYRTGDTWVRQDAQWSVTAFVVVWGLDPANVYTLAVKGMARHYQGSAWEVLQVQTPMKTPAGDNWPASLKVPPEPQLDYVGAYGTSPDDLVFFTSDRTLIRFNDDYVL